MLVSGELSVTELVRNFAEYINRVVYLGERFVIVRANRPVGELRPVPTGGRLGDLNELLESLPRLSPDEATDFATDLDRSRADLDAFPSGDPWASS